MQTDVLVDNGPGNVVLADMNAVLQALATCMSGPVAPTTPTPGMLWLDTSVSPNGFLRQRNRDNMAWATVIGLPHPATDAEIAAGVGDGYVTPHDVAQMQAAQGVARNRLVNPAMQISQENGDTLGAVSSYYAADQWFVPYIGPVCSVQRVASVTPRGSPKRLRVIVTTAKPALAAADFASFFQYIEGVKVADFGWGAAGAKPITVRFGWRSPAGTYALNLRSGGRTYTKTFTISAAQAGVDTEQAFAIPGDVVGALVTDNTLSIVFSITIAAGTTYQGVEGWQAGVMLNTAACSNGVDTVGKTFELFDVGLYLDIAGTGVPPQWQVPDTAAELRQCQRYYVQVPMIYSNSVNAVGNWQTLACLPVDMRTGAQTMSTLPTNSTQSANFGTAVTYIQNSARAFRMSRLSTATANQASLYQQVTAVSARM